MALYLRNDDIYNVTLWEPSATTILLIPFYLHVKQRFLWSGVDLKFKYIKIYLPT